MDSLNYITSIVKILEAPKQKKLNNNTLITQFRVQLPQTQSLKIVDLTFLGMLLTNDIASYYKINDYIIIEGFIMLRSNQLLNLSVQTNKKIEILVLKVYPFFGN